MIAREQVRMARAALGWGVRELAAAAGVAANTISRFESGTDARGSTLLKMQRALEKEGVVFLDETEDAGPGVRLRKHREK